MNWKEAAMYYVNLDSRPDRNEVMKQTLSSVGLTAERVRGIPWKECNIYNPKFNRMLQRSPGAVGCMLSQMKCMRMALEAGKDAWVCEDDLVICPDIKERLELIQEFCNTHEWSIIWMGGTVHISPPYWHTKNHDGSDLKGECDCDLQRDAEPTDNPRFIRTYAAFSTHSYIVNKDCIEDILFLLDHYMYSSIGIDYSLIKLQPHLKTYMFMPGCIKQYDNESSIGQGMTIFSGFKALGDYWYQDYKDNFDPAKINWKESVK